MHKLMENKRAWTRGLKVNVMELIDGRQAKFSIYRKNADWEYQYALQDGHLLDDRILGMLNVLVEDKDWDKVTLHCVAAGRDYNPTNDYGMDSELFLTDIETDEGFLDDDLLVTYAELFQFMLPPSYIKGSYAICLPNQFKAGCSTVAPGTQITTPFKERIGIVVKPLMEAHSPILGGRLIGVVYNPKYEAL